MSNARKCYQLFTSGNSVNGWQFKMRSRAIFADKAEAERHILDFEARCCDNSQIECAVPGSLKTKVVELEFYD